MFFKKSFIVLFGFVFLAVAAASYAGPIKFARYPNSGHGKIAFTYAGDIWVAGIDGSIPRRLTDHLALDVFPRFSPDGKWIAFTSNRMGNDDVWVIPSAGGEARQITFQSANDTVQYWTPDGKGIIFATSLGANPWGSPLHIAPLDGGNPVPMDMDIASAGMMSQDGFTVAFNRNRMTYWRKHYRGNNQTNVWIQDLKTKKIVKLTDLDVHEFRSHVQNASPMWGADGMIYFLSERDGFFNIWKISPKGGEPKQITFHKKDGAQFPSISSDGKVVTYENEFDLWKLDVPDGKPEKIIVDLDFEPKKNPVEYLYSENKADGYQPSPDGNAVAVDFHGELFLVPSEQGVGEMKQVTSSGWRDRYEAWSPDGKWIAYVSDQSLEEEIWLYETATGQRRKLTEHESAKTAPVWSPDSKQLAYVAANTLFLYDVPSARNSKIAFNKAGGFSVREFSKDGKWILFGRSDADQNAEIYLCDIAAGKEFNLTRNPFRDSGGRLTPDGKRLIFTSLRDGGVNHLFAVSLERETENAFDPLVVERNKKEKPEKEEKPKTDAAYALRIDAEGIDRRAAQLTKGLNPVEDYFLSADGKTVYFTSKDDKGDGLFSVDLDGKNQKKVVDGRFPGLFPTTDRKTIFYSQDNGVYKMTLANKEKNQVKFNFPIKIDKRAEWEQVFEEAWRVMKYRFYDENMHGYDWKAIKAQYKPLLKYVAENQDLYDLCNEMIGELNASHTGVSGPSGIDVPPTYKARFLGFEMAPDQGGYKVTHVFRNGPADKEWIGLKAGDRILALNGVRLKAEDNYWRILNEQINDFVSVEISASTAAGASARTVRIETVPSLRDIMYEEWVAGCRGFVDKESDGRIAYVHIRAMDETSLKRFQNEVDQLWNKDGIVIDIRYNGGGNIDEQLLDILERRPYSFVTSRWGAPTWGRRYRQAIAGPKVMLINQRSFSDAEMTPAGFRVLGLGRLVGTPTGGGVIWTGSYRLLNGASIRTPGMLAVTYDPSKPNRYGVNLENFGVPPDVFVENSPEDELKGYDRQLKAAVEEIKKMLKEGVKK